MKNIKRKSISMLLIVALIVTMAVPAFAIDDRTTRSGLSIMAQDLFIYQQSHDVYGRIIEEVAVMGDTLFYFIVTDEYVFSAQIDASGTYQFAFRYIDVQDVIVTGTETVENVMALSTDLRMCLADLNTDSDVIQALICKGVSDILVALHAVIVGDIYSFATEMVVVEIEYCNTESVIVDEFALQSLDGFAVQSNSNYHRTANALLAAYFRPFSNFYLGTASEVRNNIRATATVRENLVVRHERGINGFFVAGTTLAVIGVFATAPVSTIAVILGVSGAAVSVASGVRLDFAVEHFTRNVNVNGTVLVTATRFVDHHVLRGEVNGQVRYQRNLTRAPMRFDVDPNFGNVPALQQQGINIFFR